MLINRMKVLQACTNKSVAQNVHIEIANSLPALLMHLKRENGYVVDAESVWNAMKTVGITNHYDAYAQGAVSVIQWLVENKELDIVLVVDATEANGVPDGEAVDGPVNEMQEAAEVDTPAAVETATKKRTSTSKK